MMPLSYLCNYLFLKVTNNSKRCLKLLVLISENVTFRSKRNYDDSSVFMAQWNQKIQQVKSIWFDDGSCEWLCICLDVLLCWQNTYYDEGNSAGYFFSPCKSREELCKLVNNTLAFAASCSQISFLSVWKERKAFTNQRHACVKTVLR